MKRYRNLLLLAAVALVVVATLLVQRRSEPAVAPSSRPSASASDSSLLVVTWAPSLCKVESSASGCRSGRVDKRGQSFLLHGLWPQPRDRQYCDVPAKDRDRKPVELPDELQARLRDTMSDSTYMTKHEWYAHGSCSGVTPTEYFTVATTLAEQAIEVLDPVFDRAAGSRLSSRTLREAFDARFGKGAGSRVGMSCRDAHGEGSVVYEVRLSLPPVVALAPDPPSLTDALAAGPTVPPGCGQAAVP